MKPTLSAGETGLLVALMVALVLAGCGPFLPQYANYHAFADQRTLWGLPHAMDVLSNLPFAIMGVAGLVRLHATPERSPGGAQRPLATVFFAGLVITALCSAWYHLDPTNASLRVDRLGMVLAFAGLLGLAVADRVSARAGVCTSVVVLLLGPPAIETWAIGANLLPWSVLQGGGMLLLLLLAQRKPQCGAWDLPLNAVLAWYVVAKLLELADHPIYLLTHEWVSGHSLKHVAAAMAAWPLLALMHNGYPARPSQHGAKPAIVNAHTL